MKKRVLLIDDDQDFLATRREVLENSGYEVVTAASLDEARVNLRTRYVHLAAVDVCMDDNASQPDTSGLQFIQEPEFADIVKIILTGRHFSLRAINEAMKPRANPQKLPSAVQYLSKYDDPDTQDKAVDAMIRVVGEVFTKHTGINWSLEMEWPSPNFARDLAAWLNVPEGEWSEHGEELTALLMMAFHDFDRARIDRRLWHTDLRQALAVTAWRDETVVDRIVVISAKSAAAKSDSMMAKRAPDGRAQYIPPPLRPPRTLHYAADLYELPGGRLDQVRPLRQFYFDSQMPALKKCLPWLLKTGLIPEGQSGLVDDAAYADVRLREHAGLDEAASDRLNQAIERVREATAAKGVATIRVSEGRMLIRSLERLDLDLPDPADWLDQSGPARFPKPLAWGEVNSLTSPDSVLVASDGRAWLTDLDHVVNVPLLSTLADLETLFIYDLHPFQNPTEFADVMKYLLRSVDLKHPLEAPAAESKKLFVAIQQIREQAAQYGDGVAYFRSLFYYTTRRLLVMSSEGADPLRMALQLSCACIGLGMLADQLDRLDGTKTVARSDNPELYHDEDGGRFWLGDRLLPLTETQYRFLFYLWQRPRQYCSNDAIMSYALNASQGEWNPNYPAEIVKNIRAAIGGMRKQYLVNDRRKGYALYPDARPEHRV